MKIIESIRSQAIWGKLACVSAILTALSPLFLVYEHFEDPFFMWPKLAVGAIRLLVLAPGLYLAVFSLWHWHTRHRGKNSFAWLLFFACYAFLFPYLAFFLPALAYFVVHVAPDVLEVGAYRKEPTAVSVRALPKRYQYIRGALFIFGILLLTWGLAGAIAIRISHTAIFDIYYSCLRHKVGEPLSQGEADAIWTAAKVGKGFVRLLFGLACATALGCVLVLASQRLRWRLLDDEQKDELKKRIGI